jgi:hypothetical protein
VSGFASLPWQAPADILAELASIDGNRVGFYLPYGGRSGYDAPGSNGADVGSSWLTAPPQLYYQPYTDPIYSPDYIINARQGTDVQLDTSVQPLADVMFVNHQTISGRQLSEVVEDFDIQNYAYAQGFRVADEFDIQPAVAAATATSLGAQDLKSRRQATITGHVTITDSGANRNPILTGGGATIKHLATVRPGSVHITGMNGSGRNQSGAYITHVEWWGQSLGNPETIQLTLASPTDQALERRQAVAALRANRQRVKRLPA